MSSRNLATHNAGSERVRSTPSRVVHRSRRRSRATRAGARWLVAALALLSGPLGAATNNNHALGRIVGPLVAPGVRITPTASPDSTFEALDPDIAADPTIRATQGVTTTTSPDGRTLLVLTSGYNYVADAQFNTVSFDEFVFVYDITGGSPRKTQVIKVPNTFMGIAWHPSGRAFYVAGGINDNVHVFEQQGTDWIRAGEPIPLGHTTGLGLGVAPMAAGVAVNGNGTRLLVANLENDSVSLVDLVQRAKIAEIDLRPGMHSPSREGVPGGEFPLWVAIKGNSKAYVSSLRDRQIVVLDFDDDRLTIKRRIHVPGNPNRMILDSDQQKLIVALDNSDSVAVIDTDDDSVRRIIDLNVPFGVSSRKNRFTGSHPNSLALSPDDSVLYVTQGGTNSVAVVPLDREGHSYMGLIPTGWYPNSVSVSADGGYLYVVNAIGQAGPNPQFAAPENHNQYVLQLRKAGLLSLPVPSPKELAALTRQVLFNNGAHDRYDDRGERTMDFLRKRIKHVIYIVKENRTYDQVLGDLEKGNGDPSLMMFPEPISPNHHQLARQFVTLDNFYCSGAVSGDGWVWSTAGRTSDFTEKTIAVNYAGRGASYDYEGMNRNINVAQPTLAERRAVNPVVPDDPDLLPGTADVAALDGPGGEKGKGYIWDAARRAGLTVRNYGFFGDWTLNYLPDGQGYPPLLREPRKEGVRVFFPAATGLRKRLGSVLPRIRHAAARLLAIQGMGKRVRRVRAERAAAEPVADRVAARSLRPVRQRAGRREHTRNADGRQRLRARPHRRKGRAQSLRGQHADLRRRRRCAGRSGPRGLAAIIAYVIGPYVKQGAVASKHYSNPSMLRTIVDILGVEPMGLQVALAEPMTDVFDKSERHWTYRAIVPEVLRTTQLPLPAAPPPTAWP